MSDSAAGYEHLHEFAHWIFGTGIGHSGVRLNIQHWQNNVSRRYAIPGKKREPFFGNHTAKCREFIQTGMACWSCSIPLEATSACCNLESIGGDGTHIGISHKKAVNVDSIWQPEIPRSSFVKWQRSMRRPASFKAASDDEVKLDDAGAGISAACKVAVSLLRDTEKKIVLEYNEMQDKLRPLPPEIQDELIRWYAGLTSDSSQWKPLQQILLCAVSSESINGAFPVRSLNPRKDLLSLHQDLQSSSKEVRLASMTDFLRTNESNFNTSGMPFHVWKLVYSQVHAFDSDGGLQGCTHKLLHFLGKSVVYIA